MSADEVPDNLLLFPSSKILFKENGKFIFEKEVLSTIINNSRQAYKIREDIPVTLLSILGSPSNEKFLFAKSLVEYYEHGMKDISLFTGAFKPNTKHLETSGVYLVPKPFLVEQDKNRSLVWILYLYQSENAVDADIRLLERFLLLASSRIVEVKFEKEPLLLLHQWCELEGLEQPRCDDFLYVFPSDAYFSNEEQECAKLRSVAEGRNKLYYKMERCRDGQTNPSTIAKIPQVSVIEMKTLNSPLYSNFSQFQFHELIISQSLKQSIREVHQYFKLGGTQIDKQGRELQLGNLFDFLKDCTVSTLSYKPYSQPLELGNGSLQDFLEEIQANAPTSTLSTTGAEGNQSKSNKTRSKCNETEQIRKSFENLDGIILPHMLSSPSPQVSTIPSEPESEPESEPDMSDCEMYVVDVKTGQLRRIN